VTQTLIGKVGHNPSRKKIEEGNKELKRQENKRRVCKNGKEFLDVRKDGPDHFGIAWGNALPCKFYDGWAACEKCQSP
tara:strand:+ start:833 stop:1066 length:234 start_codon:yes stop_codon:yes gene_type:complete